MSSSAPLLVTLMLDADSFAFFDELRRAHFPSERNKVPAHLTLFHQLPGAETNAVMARLHACAAELEPFPMQVTGLWMLGQGVAYRLASPALQRLREDLAQDWWEWLIPQDRTRHFSPHITVQNKVSGDTAKALHAELSARFSPFTVWAEGLELFLYRGHWEPVARFPFDAAPAMLD